MTIKLPKSHAELTAFDAADKAWQEQLEAAFGSKAGVKRYTVAGRGDKGTPLRSAYEAREAARIAWDGAR